MVPAASSVVPEGAAIQARDDRDGPRATSRSHPTTVTTLATSATSSPSILTPRWSCQTAPKTRTHLHPRCGSVCAGVARPAERASSGNGVDDTAHSCSPRSLSGQGSRRHEPTAPDRCKCVGVLGAVRQEDDDVVNIVELLVTARGACAHGSARKHIHGSALRAWPRTLGALEGLPVRAAIRRVPAARVR